MQYQQRIQSYDLAQLRDLWQTIQERNTPNWAAGKALEYLIIRGFELENAQVRYPYTVEDFEGNIIEQIDGVVYAENVACLIECKDTEKPINFEAIAKLRNQLMRRPSATIASIFSMGGFTEPALSLLRFIHPQTVLAWERHEITYCLENRKFCASLIKKYRTAIERGDYKYNISIDIEGD
jgi:hypothetical protein